MIEVGIGDVVLYVDKTGVSRPALVQTVWKGNGEAPPSLNLVFVSPDESREDTYGRQTEHETSVPHKEQQQAPGNYWTK